MLRNFGITIPLMLLAACMSKEQLAEKIEGSWHGVGDKVKWCIDYTTKPYRQTGENTVQLYRELELGDGAFRYELREGVWRTSRGKRLFQNISLTHDSQGKVIPSKTRKGGKHRLLVVEINERQFSFVPEESDIEPRVNFRAESCTDYRHKFEQYIAHLQQTVAAGAEPGSPPASSSAETAGKP